MPACCATPLPPCGAPSPPRKPIPGSAERPPVQDADLNQFHILNPVEYPDRAGYNKFTRHPRSQGRAAPSASLAAPGDANAPLDAAELLRRAAKGNPAAWEPAVSHSMPTSRSTTAPTLTHVGCADYTGAGKPQAEHRAHPAHPIIHQSRGLLRSVNT